MNGLYEKVKDHHYVLAIPLDGRKELTATVTGAPEFITVTAGPIGALLTKTMSGAS